MKAKMLSWIRIFGVFIFSALVFNLSTRSSIAARFDTDAPIEQVIASVQNPASDAKEKAHNVKLLGKYFPITEKGKGKRGVAPLEAAQKAISALIPLLDLNEPQLLFNTIEALSHIVQNYPKETYEQVKPYIEKMQSSPFPKVAKKAQTALTNMAAAYQLAK